MTDNKLGITKSITGLDNQPTLLHLEGFNSYKYSEQQIWWDTFSVDDSLCVIQKFEDPSRQGFNTFSKETNKYEMWF
jgi:hypothetical protein